MGQEEWTEAFVPSDNVKPHWRLLFRAMMHLAVVRVLWKKMPCMEVYAV